MAKSTSSISFIKNSYVGCDEYIEGCNPFNPDEEEFGDCLFNPESDLKPVKKRNGLSVTVIVPPIPLKRKKHVVINDPKSNNIHKESMNHKKIESTTSPTSSRNCNRSNDVTLAVARKIEISPILTTKTSANLKVEPKIVSKPPLPPKPQVITVRHKTPPSTVTSMPVVVNTGNVQKMKRKVEEMNNASLVQKLTAQTEQLRLEIAQLKTALSQEKNAVRGLRAQNESESRRLKQDIKRLQDTLQSHKASSLKRTKGNVVVSPEAHNHHEINRLNLEIVSLKEAFKCLEDKYQSSLESEKRKISELKDLYEQRLTQTSLTAKNEIQRMLEELKSKEHHLSQFRKELSSNGQQSTENQFNEQHQQIHNEALFSQKMRKINEFEHTNDDDTDVIDDQLHFDENKYDYATNSNINCTNTTTCGMDLIESQPHESFNETNLVNCKEIEENFINKSNKMEAQPINDESTIVKSKDFNRGTSVASDLDSALSSAPQSLSPQPQTCPNSPVVWPKERDKHRQEAENEEIKGLMSELECARQQIKTLEDEITELKNKDQTKKLRDRCKKLEQQEAALTKELHEVREQNELLEFRIIELEEAHDKWSVRSNSTPGGTKDVWTDTEKESDDIVLSERSDSGVTSPNNSHHHSEDQHSVSPCDLSLMDQIPTDEVRKRIRAMSKRSCYDEDDKLCLLQVLTLLNNLEALSKDHDTISTRSSTQSCSEDDNTYKPSESETHHLRSLSLVTASPFKSNQVGKIVATVQPFSSSNEDLYRSRSSTSPQDIPVKKTSKSWISTSLQESGVFEGDPIDFCTVTTQTEPEDFPEKTNAELCAEIEKLNKFREKIEEFSTKKLPLLPPSEIERRLQYYRERVSILENKVLVYESSGDTQMKHLADRLQREVQLESIVKQYSDKIAKLTKEFRRIEDERNELEEIENDTRLANQRIEEELEVMSQRNVELEISKDTYMEKYHEAKESVACLEECLQKCEERIFVLEEHENDLRHQLETISQFIPLIGAYCAWKVKDSVVPAIPSIQPALKETSKDEVDKCCCADGKTFEALQARINELLTREKDLLQNISELNRAYNETLENADNLWAQMEKDYKERISQYEEGEMSLKSKLAQLEDRLKHDSAYAQERITHLEESEASMKDRISKLIKENKEILAKNSVLLEECRQLKEEYAKLRQYVEGPASEALEKEKKKIKVLEDELLMTTKMLKHTEEVHQDELTLLKTQLKAANKELTHTEVTNSELKEEVETLEARIKELANQRTIYEDKIKYLTDELKSKERAVKPPYLMERTLAQELARPVRRGYSSDSSDSSKRSTEFLDRIEEARPNREFRSVADTIIMNAETRVCRATKRSFVEEVSQVPLRLKGGADRNKEPRLSISQVMENIPKPISDSEMTASLELLDSDSINLQLIIDLDLEGNIHLTTDSPLAEGLTDNLCAEIISKQTEDGFQTEIQFSKPGNIEVNQLEISPNETDLELSKSEDDFTSGNSSSDFTEIDEDEKSLYYCPYALMHANDLSRKNECDDPDCPCKKHPFYQALKDKCTQSVRPMGLTNSNETLVSRVCDNNEPEPTTESTNQQLKLTSEQTSDNEICVNHRVTVSNQYECRMLSNTCSGLTPEKEDILLENLKREICALKKTLGINDDTNNNAAPMDGDQENETPELNKEKLQQKCSFTKLNPRPLCPVIILCVHPSPPDQLLVHWKPTTALSVSGYEIDIDGVPAAKTYSQIRTSALLYDVNLKQNHVITIYAIPCPEDSHPDPIFCTPGCFYYQPNSNNCCRCPQ